MSKFAEKLGNIFNWSADRSQEIHSKIDTNLIEAENQKLFPFKIGDKVKLIRFAHEPYEVEDGWEIWSYSDQFGEALLRKPNLEHELQVDDNTALFEPKTYLYEKAAIGLLLTWNPEFRKKD